MEFLAWSSELDLPDPEAVLADPTSFVLPERGDRAYAALSSVAAAVVADPTLDTLARRMEGAGQRRRTRPRCGRHGRPVTGPLPPGRSRCATRDQSVPSPAARRRDAGAVTEQPSAELRHKMAAARLWAAQRFPYLASVLFASPVVYRHGNETVSADRHWRLYVDIDGAAHWPVETLGSLLVVQANHLLREHAERADALNLAEEDSDAWSDAADAEINDDLVDLLSLPEGDEVVLPDDFGMQRGRLAEEYFEVVRKEQRQSDTPERGSGSTRQGPARRSAGGRERDRHGVVARPQRRQRGSDPPAGRRGDRGGGAAGPVTCPPVCFAGPRHGCGPRWTGGGRLPRRSAAASATSAARSTTPTDARHAGPGRTPGVVLPALRRPQPEVVVVCDTSGSMGERRLEQVLAEVEGLLRSVGVGWAGGAVRRRRRAPQPPGPPGRPGRAGRGRWAPTWAPASLRPLPAGHGPMSSWSSPTARRHGPPSRRVGFGWWLGSSVRTLRTHHAGRVRCGSTMSPETGAPGLSRSIARPREPRPRWYRQVPPAVLRLDCGGARHTVRWRKGRLVLLDHDLAAEVGLMALGAERPACLTFLERWRASVAPNGSRGLPGGSGLRSGRGGVAGEDLRSFGGELSNIVELARLVRAERRWADPSLSEADRRRLVDRFMAELRAATAASLQPSSAQRGRQQLVLRARPLPSGEEASAEVVITTSRIELDLSLPLSWVIDIAGRGLQHQPDRLVLAVIDTEHDRGHVAVTGIIWEVPAPHRVNARLDQWWTARRGDEWVPVEGSRPIRPSRSLWWTSTQR